MKTSILSLTKILFFCLIAFLSNAACAQGHVSPLAGGVNASELGQYADDHGEELLTLPPGTNIPQLIAENWIVAQSYFGWWKIVSNDQVTTVSSGVQHPSCYITALKHLNSHVESNNLTFGTYTETGANGYFNNIHTTQTTVTVSGHYGIVYEGFVTGIDPAGSCIYLAQ